MATLIILRLLVSPGLRSPRHLAGPAPQSFGLDNIFSFQCFPLPAATSRHPNPFVAYVNCPGRHCEVDWWKRILDVRLQCEARIVHRMARVVVLMVVVGAA